MDTAADAERLLKRLRSSDAKAFEELVRGYGPRVYAAIRGQIRRMGQPALRSAADDFFQDVFRDFFEKRRAESIREASRLGPYLVASAVSRVVDEARRYFLRAGPWSERRPEEPAAPETGPLLEEADRRIAAEIVEKELDFLPVKEELVFRLVCQHGMTSERVASLLGLEAPTVRSLLSRTRAGLRQVLRAKGF